MRLGPIIGLASLSFFLFACGGDQNDSEATPFPSESPLLPTATATVSIQTPSTATLIPTPAPSAQRSLTPQATATVSRITPTPMATPAAVTSPTLTPTLEPSATSIPSTPTRTATPTATIRDPSHTPTRTTTPSPSAMRTPAATMTLVPTPSSTVTPNPTATERPTSTAVPTLAVTQMPTPIQISTPNPTMTPTATQTSTPTPIPTAVPTPPLTPTPTAVSTPTLTPTAATIPQSTIVGDSIRVSSITSAAFKVTWVTNSDTRGWVEWGETSRLGNTTQDERGPDTVDDVHSVQIGNLKPETTYFFDVVIDSDRQNNGGAHYSVRTSPIIRIPPLDIGIGFLTGTDGKPVDGCVVHLSFVDNDSTGSPGRSQPLSVLVGESGAWVVVIGSVLQADSTAFFNYNRGGGDNLVIEADCGAQGRGELIVDTSALEPTAPLVIKTPEQ
jgi:hypothetical protein